MEIFYDIIHKIACFLLFISLLEQVIAESEMKKYVRFFSGIILCLFLINASTSLFGKRLEIEMDWSIYDTTGMEHIFENWEEKSQNLIQDLAQDEEEEAKQSESLNVDPITAMRKAAIRPGRPKQEGSQPCFPTGKRKKNRGDPIGAIDCCRTCTFNCIF